MKYTALILTILTLSACQTSHKQAQTKSLNAENPKTPTEVVAQSTVSEWRPLDAENTLYLKLDSGLVVIELLPDLAPIHVMNTKALVRQGIFDNTSFYRVIEGFVAQGGPLFESDALRKPLNEGEYTVPNELTSSIALGDDYVAFDQQDGFADETGFIKGFAVGRDLSSQESWLLHCYGALGMGRDNELDSGGTELYIVNGGAQRYLDRNVTIFGRVIDGMSHIQSLERGNNLNGAVDLTGKNSIKSIQVAADLSNDQILPIEVMKTNTASFRQLLNARKNRTGEWFTHQHNYIDACGVPIPVKLKE